MSNFISDLRAIQVNLDTISAKADAGILNKKE